MPVSPSDDARELSRLAGRLAMVGGWSFARSDGVMHWSDEVCALHQVPSGTRPSIREALGFLAPDSREHARSRIAAALRTGSPWDDELELHTANGEVRWVQVVAEAVRGENGRITGLQGAMQDITRRREAERERAHLRDRLTAVLEEMGDAFFSFDSEFRFAWLNQAAASTLGVTLEEVQGKPFLECFPEARGSEFMGRIQKVLRGGEPQKFESWGAHFRRWFRVQVYPSPEGASVFFADITEERAREEALRKSEERFRLVARATTDAVWDWNLETGRIWWSEGLRTLFGHDPDEMEESEVPWTHWVHEEDRARVQGEVDRLLRGEVERYQCEYRFARADGGWATVMDRGYALQSPDPGQGPQPPTRLVGSLTDLTEARQLEAQFLRAQRLEGIGTLAGGIAHDLNNVLAPILMAIDLLRGELTRRVEPGAPVSEGLELLGTMESSARRGADLVRQILTFARGEQGSLVPVAPDEILEEVHRIMRDTFPRNLDLRLRAHPGLLHVQADATQLHQVLLNLCVNARDAMPDGGRLELEAATVHVDETYAGHRRSIEPGTFVRMSVRDTGSGIETEDLERIFDPFFTTKEMGKGTGLGLPTVQAIVRRMQGFVNVYSEPGRGSTFAVYLPALSEAVAEGAQGVPRPRRRGRGEEILVVDDEPALVSILTHALTHAGYRVRTAGDGREGVEVFHRHRDSLSAVITDSMMPRLDGAGLIHEVRTLRPDIAIVATSGLHPEGAMAELVRAGQVRFLPKPYSGEQLLAELEHLLGTT